MHIPRVTVTAEQRNKIIHRTTKGDMLEAKTSSSLLEVKTGLSKEHAMHLGPPFTHPPDPLSQ
jgi:hypothetical protein